MRCLMLLLLGLLQLLLLQQHQSALAYSDGLETTAVLVVTHKSVRIQPIDSEHYQTIDLPYGSWEGANVDFDFDPTSNSLVLLSENEKADKLQLHVVRFPNVTSYSDFTKSQGAIVYLAKNKTVDGVAAGKTGEFSARSIRFAPRLLNQSVSFFMWSIPEKPTKTLFVEQTFCQSDDGNDDGSTSTIGNSTKKRQLKSLSCVGKVSEVTRKPESTFKEIVDVSIGENGNIVVVFLATNPDNLLKPPLQLFNSSNPDQIIELNRRFTSFVLASHDPVTNIIWLAGVVDEKLLLSRFKDGKAEEAIIEVKTPGYEVFQIFRLSVYNNVACISFEQSVGSTAGVAVAKVDPNVAKITAKIIQVNGLVGAACLSPESALEFSKFAPAPITDFDVKRVSNSRTSQHVPDRSYIVLLIIGLLSIFLGILLAVGSAYFFYLKKSMQGFRRFGRVWFRKQAADDYDDDDDKLLEHGEQPDDPCNARASSGTQRQPKNQSAGYSSWAPTATTTNEPSNDQSPLV